MKISFFKKRLFAPLYVSFLVLFLLLLTQESISLVVNVLRQRTFNRATQTVEIERESEKLLKAAIEEKAALQGYLLNQDSEFLLNYQLGRDTFRHSLYQLSLLLKDDSSQQDNLKAIEIFEAQWQREFAQPAIEGTFDVEFLIQQSSLEPLEQKVNSILAHENVILAQQNKWLKHLDWLNQISLNLSGLSLGIIIIGSGLNFILLRRRVILPIQDLIRVGHAWRDGQLAVQINQVSEDEIGILAATLNRMASNIRVRQDKIQQHSQQLEDLIGTLAHDLRTPLLANRSTLNAIIGGAFGPVSENLQQLLAEYVEANDDLVKLVETLLDISRYEAGGSQILNLEPLDWHKICNRVIGWIQKSSPNKCLIETYIESQLPEVAGDVIEIQRVLQNLVDNAVRLSEPEQKVLIRVTLGDLEHVQVAVHDRGPGLKKQEAKSLFYRFSQGPGRQGRAGLGLYLCRQIIEAHHGKIWVVSTLGYGSTFLFLLPINYAEN